MQYFNHIIEDNFHFYCFRRTDSPWGYLPCIKRDTLSDIESVLTDSERPHRKSSFRSNSRSQIKDSQDSSPKRKTQMIVSSGEVALSGRHEASSFGSRLSPTTRRKSFRNSKKWRKVQQSENNSIEIQAQNTPGIAESGSVTSTGGKQTLGSRNSNEIAESGQPKFTQRSCSIKLKKPNSLSPTTSNASSSGARKSSQVDRLTSLAPPPMQYRGSKGGSFYRGSSFRFRRKGNSDPNSQNPSRQTSSAHSSLDQNSLDDGDCSRGRITVFDKWANDLKRAFIRGKPTLGSGSFGTSVASPTSPISSSPNNYQRFIAKASSMSGKILFGFKTLEE